MTGVSPHGATRFCGTMLGGGTSLEGSTEAVAIEGPTFEELFIGAWSARALRRSSTGKSSAAGDTVGIMFSLQASISSVRPTTKDQNPLFR